MNQIDLQNIKNKLKLYISDNAGMNNTSLAELFLSENEDIKLSVRSVRRYVSLVKEAESDLEDDIQDIDNTITTNTVEYIRVDLSDSNLKPLEAEASLTEGTSSWSEVSKTARDLVSEEKVEVKETIDPPIKLYHFDLKFGGKDYKLNRHDVDQVICAYVRQGLNLTTGLIQNILGLTPNEVKAIISRLNITKESKPYSDYSEERLSDEELYGELSDNISYLLDRLYENDGTASNKLNKIYKKSILLEKHKDLKFNSLVVELKSALPKVKLDIMNCASIELTDSEDHSHLFIPDMHIGMNQANYDIEIIREQLSYILNLIVFTPNIHVHFMGDIIHSVSGMNRKDSWKNMKQNTSGAEAIIQPYKLLIEFLGGIKTLYSVDLVGGNHDRLSSNSAEENTGEGAKLIAFMIKESLGDIPVNFDSYRIVDDVDPKMTIILLHGDKPIDKSSGESIAWTYGNSSKFNYIMTAHMHSRKQNPKDDGLNFRKEALTSFCPMDTYSKTVAHGSLPGVKLISINKDNLPLVLDIPLHYDNV